MKSLIALSILTVFATGCSLKTSIEDLKKKEKPSTSSSSPIMMKISGGANELNGSNVSVEFSVGLKEHLIEGSVYDVSASISANRPE